MTIDIAVPTYNCARWVDAFIESIVAQTHTDWRIITRDDGSRDDTSERVGAWQQRLGDKILVLENPLKQNLGALGNYGCILTACQSEFVMQGDPDDIWHPDKVAITLKAMHDASSRHGPKMPLAVCSDAEMVSEDLRQISPSFLKWTKMSPSSLAHFRQMLMESPVLGATTIVNRPLLDLALPFPAGASAQDWWLALVACAFGKIIFIAQPTIQYRRHDANDSVSPLTTSFPHMLANLLRARDRVRFLLNNIVMQANSFSGRFSDQLPEADRQAVTAIAKLPGLGPLTARLVICRHGLFFNSKLKNIGLLLLM
jgi:glycosyltransferase involved in cell wall biosynthesis